MQNRTSVTKSELNALREANPRLAETVNLLREQCDEKDRRIVGLCMLMLAVAMGATAFGVLLAVWMTERIGG